MAKVDTVSKDVRRAEREIDEVYRANPLIQLPRPEAVWFFLAHCEEVSVRDYLQKTSDDVQQTAGLVDEIVNVSKWPLRWIFGACSSGGHIHPRPNDDYYKAAWDLYDLAREYRTFETAFKYASMGYVELSIDGQRIVSKGPLRQDTRYEAYDRLVKPGETTMGPDKLGFLRAIDDSVRVNGNRFAYKLNPRLIAQGMDMMATLYPNAPPLPPKWAFPRYSAGEIEIVCRAIQVLAFVHMRARMRAIEARCEMGGYADAVLLVGSEELKQRLARYTGVGSTALDAIIGDLTFGASGQLYPDPALQPLVPVSADSFAISPVVVVGSNIRRNIAVLMNRLPAEKAVYAKVNKQREEISRVRAESACRQKGVRTWTGTWPNRDDLPDIDLVAINDEERHCLFLELKAFIEPAEAREVAERDEEIAKGVSQSQVLRAAFLNDSHALRRVLGIDDDYTATFGVVSESGIGSCLVQNDSVPVVRMGHLLARVLAGGSVKAVSQWLERRDYLPLVGVHYDEVSIASRVGDWEVDWYGIRPRIQGVYE